MQVGHEARHRLDAGRGRHGDRQHVVDEQRRGGDETGQYPEVVARDDIAAAAVGIGLDHLRLRKDHDRENADDSDGDRREKDERTDAREREDAHRLLGRVRRRRDVVRPEDREAGEDPQALALLGLHAEARAEEESADRLVRPADGTLRSQRVLADDVAVASTTEIRALVDPDVAVAGEPAGFPGALFERWGLRRFAFSLVVAHISQRAAPSRALARPPTDL